MNIRQHSIQSAKKYKIFKDLDLSKSINVSAGFSRKTEIYSKVYKSGRIRYSSQDFRRNTTYKWKTCRNNIAFVEFSGAGKKCIHNYKSKPWKYKNKNVCLFQ